MIEWVEKLLKLQDLDIKAAELQEKLADLPRQEAETQQMFQAEADASAAAKKGVQEIELTIRRLEGEIAKLKEQKASFQSKTSMIKNNDEYRSALLQIEMCDHAVSDAEDKQIAAMDELDAAKAVLKEKTQSFEAAQKRANEVRERLVAEEARLRQELQGLLESRPGLAEAVEPSVLKRYERLRSARNHHPTKPCLVPADDGTCGRCHLSVTTQEVNDTLKGKVVACSFCGALLYSAK